MVGKMVEVRSKSEGRQWFWLAEDEVLCEHCKGRGRWDSCWHCGNRGYMFTDAED